MWFRLRLWPIWHDSIFIVTHFIGDDVTLNYKSSTLAPPSPTIKKEKEKKEKKENNLLLVNEVMWLLLFFLQDYS